MSCNSRTSGAPPPPLRASKLAGALRLRTFVFGLVAAVVFHHSAIAATIVVNSAADPAGFNPGITIATLGPTVTLRDAFNAANNAGGSNLITFDPGLAGQTINLTQIGDGTGPTALSMSNRAKPNDLTIQGLTGGPGITIARSGDNQMRLFLTGVSGFFDTLTLNDLTLTGGIAPNGNWGGALLVVNATANLNRCTLSGNSATFGGAIYNRAGFLNVTNCTIANNSADYQTGQGGGIYQYVGSQVNLTNVTVTGNSAAQAGGIFVDATPYPVLVNTIVANNNVRINLPEIFGRVNGGSHNNLCSDPGTQGGGFNGAGNMQNGVNGNILGVDPLLGDLANNGGPTPTMALLPGSPAINKGAVVANITTDQRGVARDGSPDIGAYEFTDFRPSLVVTTIADEDNGTSDARFGAGTSLREALAYAASLSGPQTVSFDPALTSGGPAVITLGGSELPVSSDVSITGPGAGLLTVSGNNTSRVLHITSGKTATITGLTIANGQVSGATFPAGNGGGILNEGALTIDRCTLTNNVCGTDLQRDDGGAMCHVGSTLRVVRCTFSSNQTKGGGYGAAIATFSGTTKISASTFSANKASDGNGNGGGIANFGSATTVTNSTFAGNTALNGGAIIQYGNTLTLTQCTIVGNSAGYSGGGVERVGRDGDDTALGGCLIAQNTAPNGPDANSYLDANDGTFTSQGHNFIGNGDGALGFTAGIPGANGDIVGTAAKPIDPRVGPLQDNGGPTLTVALLPGSAAINTGATFAGVGTDQRGFPRIPYGTGGLLGRYYSVPSGTTTALLSPLSNLETLAPSASALTPRIDFGAGTESVPGDGTVLDRDGTEGDPFGGIGVYVGFDNMAALWIGYITVPENASYRFTTRSDDGSVLYVDDQLVVSNDNLQPMTNASGAVTLSAGRHSLRIGYIEATGQAGMQVSWEQLTGAAPFARQIIPPTSLSYGSAPDIGALEDAVGNDDPDGDTLTNVQELALGTNPLSIDTDGDGFNDATEVMNGSDPTSAASVPPTTHLERVLGYGPARGLDLSGNFLYAFNVGTPGAAGQAGDANFTADNAPGITVTANNEIPLWNTPHLGASDADHVLEFVYQSIRWADNGNADPAARQLKVDLANLVPGRRYKLQLLFGENGGTGRRFDAFVDGAKIEDDFSTTYAQGSPTMTIAGSAIVHEFTASQANLHIVLDGSDVVPVPNLDRNPLLNGLTLESLSIPYTAPDVTSALRIAAGLTAAATTDARLNVEAGNNVIDIADAIRIARKVAGTDANP